MARRIGRDAKMAEIHERAGDRDVGERQPVLDEEARFGRDAFQVIEDRRQLVLLGGRRDRLVAGPPKKSGATMRLKNILPAQAVRIVSANSSYQIVRARARGSAGIRFGSGFVASR